MVLQNMNPYNLMTEFQNSQIAIKSMKHNRKDNEILAETIWIEFEEGTDMEAVQQIIDAHDPTPLPQQPTSEQQLTMEMTMAMAQMQMDNMMAIAELTNLIMAMGGM